MRPTGWEVILVVSDQGEDGPRSNRHAATALTHSATSTSLDILARDRVAASWQRYHTWLIAAALGSWMVLNYLSTLAPTVLAGDSGRFQARAYVLGIGHPTGYPTYIMLGKLFTYLPVGDIAYRVNLSSAVYAVATIVLVFLIALRLTSTVPAALATLAFAVSRTFWSQAVIAEIYTLNALLVSASLLTLLLWRDTRKDKYLLAAAFLAGFSLTNHMTSGLLIPAAMMFVWLTDRSRFRDWKLVARTALLFMIGLTPYLYLPIRAAMDPPLNYGDPSTLGNFFYLVTGRQFAGRMFAFGPEQLPDRLILYFGQLHEQYSPGLLLLALAGTILGFRRLGAATWVLLATFFAGTLAYALEYNIPDIAVYFIPTYLVLAIAMAVGIQALLDLVERFSTPLPRTLATASLSLALVLVIGWTWWTNYASVDQSNNYSQRELIERVAQAPARAAIYDPSNTTSLQYLRYVERRRLDLLVRPVRENNVERALRRDLRAGRRVFLLKPSFEQILHGRYHIRPEAGLWRVTRATGSWEPRTRSASSGDWARTGGPPTAKENATIKSVGNLTGRGPSAQPDSAESEAASYQGRTIHQLFTESSLSVHQVIDPEVLRLRKTS
ncbi:MAG: DUF2723 domain-containing protein [Chloroflexota bacterium]|nr:DUF2723 domain-containing protein [Chloroflexota bacterium]